MRADASDRKTARGVRALRRVLPDEGGGSGGREPLAELVTRIARRRIPATSFARVWILGSFQARVAAGHLAYWIRSALAEEDAKARLRAEARVAAALTLFGAMGYLRGAVMKVGQVLANLPELVPEDVADVLAALQFEAPPMHYSMIREVFLDELGREPEDLFASFDRRAFAAASLGQVHRARLRSGEEVAVKIQYPGIAGTIRADLRALRVLLQPLRLAGDWPFIRDTLADVERRLLAETDYEREARSCTEARALFGPGDGVVVPKVHDAFSTRRVLTADYLHGRHLREYLATDPAQEDRDHFTRLLVLATTRPYYRARRIFADAHPGNFLFMEDGRLGLLDFGCSIGFSDEDWRLQRTIERAAIAGDDAVVDRCIARACLFDDPAAMEPGRLAAVRVSTRWQMEPWLTDGPFDFGDAAFFRRGVDSFAALVRGRYARSAPLHLWTARFVFGSRAIAYRLKGRCDFRDIYDREAPAAPAP